MFWQCGECGGLIDAVPRVSVCPECGTASAQFLPTDELPMDLTDLREFWVSVGMEQRHLLTECGNA